MRFSRFVTAVVVPMVLVSACTSNHQAVQTPTVAASVSSSVSSPTPTPTTTSTSTPAPTTKKTVPKTTTARPKPKPKPVVRRVVRKPKAKPGKGVDPLTGQRMSLNPVIAAKIDNTYFDVPQFGVSDADIVFVEQVEGGLTRLIAVFHTSLPAEVGPVRSVRSTDAQLLPAFGTPGLVFSGGAGGPLSALAATRVVNTSTLGNAYFRSDLAYGTYNLHADLTKIADQEKKLGKARSIGFHFDAHPAAVAKGKIVRSIQVVMQAGETDFQWRSGRFVRLRHGEPVSDYQGRLEAADNVLLMNIKDEPDGTVDSIGSPSYLSRTVGSGTVTLYRDGRAVPGFWARSKATNGFTFTDARHRHLPFKPGKTWVILAPQTAQLTTG